MYNKYSSKQSVINAKKVLKVLMALQIQSQRIHNFYLNKNGNSNKNKRESKMENSTHAFRDKKLSRIKNKTVIS